MSQAVYVATRLGIPDLLADGPREVDDLARATSSHAPSLGEQDAAGTLCAVASAQGKIPWLRGGENTKSGS